METVAAMNPFELTERVAPAVTDWKVFYRDHLDQDRTSGSSQSEESALQRAGELYLRERAEIYRIEGPNGRILHREEIMRWLSANKEQVRLNLATSRSPSDIPTFKSRNGQDVQCSA